MIPGSRTSAFLWLAGTVRMSEADITGVTAYSFAQVTRPALGFADKVRTWSSLQSAARRRTHLRTLLCRINSDHPAAKIQFGFDRHCAQPSSPYVWNGSQPEVSDRHENVGFWG